MQTFELNGKTYQVESMDNHTTVAVVLKNNGEADKRFKPTKFNTDSIAHLLGDAETEQLTIQFDTAATPTATDGNNKYFQILQNGLKVGMSIKAVDSLLGAVRQTILADGQLVKPHSISTHLGEFTGIAYYYCLGKFRIEFTVITSLGFVVNFEVKILEGNIIPFAVTTHLMNVVSDDLNKFVTGAAHQSERTHTHESVESSSYFTQALEDALYHADSGELPEYAWFEDTDSYAVFIGYTVIADNLDETEAEILTDILLGRLYDQVTLWENDNVITGYIENNLFNEHIEEKAIALYGELDHGELVKAAYTTYSTALRLMGARAEDNPTAITYHSLEKHLDLLLERGDSHGESDFYTVSSYEGNQVIVCQKPFLYTDKDTDSCYVALALMDGKTYAAQWKKDATDWDSVAYMQQL